MATEPETSHGLEDVMSPIGPIPDDIFQEWFSDFPGVRINPSADNAQIGDGQLDGNASAGDVITQETVDTFLPSEEYQDNGAEPSSAEPELQTHADIVDPTLTQLDSNGQDPAEDTADAVNTVFQEGVVNYNYDPSEYATHNTRPVELWSCPIGYMPASDIQTAQQQIPEPIQAPTDAEVDFAIFGFLGQPTEFSTEQPQQHAEFYPAQPEPSFINPQLLQQASYPDQVSYPDPALPEAAPQVIPMTMAPEQQYLAAQDQFIDPHSAGGTEVGEEAPGANELVLKFSSVEEANEWPSRGPQPSDPTIPKTVADKKVIVKKIIMAMLNCSRAEDNEPIIKPWRNGKYPIERLEVVAWNLLEACINRHLSGPLCAGQSVKHNKSSSNVPKFQERMAHILECLHTHKTICKHLLDPFYLYNFVDDPQGARSRVRSNKSLNQRKSVFMSAGKTALEEKGELPSSAAGSKKPTNKKVRFLKEDDLPTPSSTPVKSDPVANKTKAPGPNPGPSTEPSAVSSPRFESSSHMSASAQVSTLNSPAAGQTFATNQFGHYIDGIANMPANTQFAGNMMHNPGSVTYPMATGVRNYSPPKPSGLQNVMVPDYLAMAHAEHTQMVMQDGSAPQTAAPQMDYSQFTNPQMVASQVTQQQMAAAQFDHQQMQMQASQVTHPQFNAQHMGTPLQNVVQFGGQQQLGTPRQTPNQFAPQQMGTPLQTAGHYHAQQFQTPQHLIQTHVPTPQGPSRYPKPNLLPEGVMTANPSGLSAARTPYGHGRKRSNPDASGQTSTGSPLKRVRR